MIAEKIITKLEQVCTSKLELSQRALQLLRLAVLRNLNKTVYKLAKKMAITIDIKEDALYQEGLEQGLQKGKEEGLRKGQEEGKVAAKEEAAVNMIKEGFSDEVVACITRFPAERIGQLRQQLEASE